jgi:hypothetical protein
MSASTLERSIFWMRKIAFSAILEDRMKANKHLEFPFEAKSKYVHKGPTCGVFAHMEAIKKLTDENVKDFGIYAP